MGENICMMEMRKNVRYRSVAKARINEVTEGETLLKDISITGCRVECTSYAEIGLHSQYKIEIIPEDPAKIGAFEILAEASWIRTEGYSGEIGFFIVESPKRRQFERYVDYLAWRYSKSSGTAGPAAPVNSGQV